MSPSLTTFVFEAANFVALAAVLGWAFFRPVQAAIEERRANLEAERRDAEHVRAEAEKRLAEVDARRREVEASLVPLRDEARSEATRQAETILAAAKRRAGEERARLEAELAARRQEHAHSLSRDAAAAARALVARLLAEIGGPDLDTGLARAACARLAALPAASRSGTVEVETARVLDADTRARLAAVIGPGGSMKDRVVPELGAGIRIITAAGLVDASAAGIAAWVERELLARMSPGDPGG